MTLEQYEKLNYYLNGCFKELEKSDSFLLANIECFARMSDDYVHMTNNYKFEVYTEQNNLSYNDVYLLAREIIESIDKDYLKYYDELIESGKLDFSYSNDYPGSAFIYCLKKDERIININRNFNYTDVLVLVHEFMHYMNGLGDEFSFNRNLLTEAISIYFEEYARNYLLDKGIPKEELYFNERIILTRETASNFNWYSFILIAYNRFGNIDENTYKLLSDFVCPITKEELEEECQKVLKVLDKRKEEFDFEYKMLEENSEKNYENELFNDLVKLVNKNYKYIFGTLIAYYALKYSTVEKMTYLCNHINDLKMQKWV